MKQFFCGLRDGVVIFTAVWFLFVYDPVAESRVEKLESECYDLRVRIEALEDRAIPKIPEDER